MRSLTPEEIISKLNMEPLPEEGGFFRRTYLSDRNIEDNSSMGHQRSAGSAIYYLLTDADNGFSRFHRLNGDEIYHFYGGGPAELHLFSSSGLHPDGSGYKKILLGNNLLNGEVCQFMVPAGTIQGLRPKPGVSWVLLGTTMTPAYDDRGFEMIPQNLLISLYPTQTEIIRKFY